MGGQTSMVTTKVVGRVIVSKVLSWWITHVQPNLLTFRSGLSGDFYREVISLASQWIYLQVEHTESSEVV